MNTQPPVDAPRPPDAAQGDATNHARRNELRRMKRLALACLLAAFGGLLLSLMQGGSDAHGGWAWLKAFCEAAAVGALADWFAVVALFRRPMGLPIPHTALVPQNKARIADNLARFVSRNFLSPQVLLGKLQALNPAAVIGQWLSAPENLEEMVGSVRQLASEGLARLDDAAARQAISQFVLQRAQDWDAAATGASVLQLLTRGGHHQELLDGALARLKEYLDTPETRQLVAERLLSYAQKEWPKLISLVNSIYSVDKMAGSLGETLARQLVDEVQTALAQPDHAVRQRFEAWLEGFITRLGTDSEFADQVQQFKQQLLERQDVQRYAQGLWDNIRQALADDLARNDGSVLLAQVRQGLSAMGRRLADDPSLAGALNTHLLAFAGRTVSQLNDSVTRHIAQTIQGWNDSELVDQLELGVGRDLQFIRLNGTLVGGLVGLVLHAAFLLFA